jgi:hypothetical protein
MRYAADDMFYLFLFCHKDLNASNLFQSFLTLTFL